MENSRIDNIEILAGNGKLEELKELLGLEFTQYEIDIALNNAIAYSEINTAEYLLSLGADISWGNYEGVYYSVHNDELEGLKFAISKGVGINVSNGMILNTSIMTAMNTKSIELVKWIIENGANSDLLTKESLNIVDNFGTKELKELIRNAIK